MHTAVPPLLHTFSVLKQINLPSPVLNIALHFAQIGVNKLQLAVLLEINTEERMKVSII
jgi:hypothetical protein